MPTAVVRPCVVRAAVVLSVLAVAGCGSDSGDGASLLPTVASIDDAIAAVESDAGGPQHYFEISAHLTGVTAIVAVDDGDGDPATNEARSYTFVNGELETPVTLGVGEGSTFTADSVQIDPDRVFDGVIAQIEDPVVTDFAVTGGPDGDPIYDCTLRSGKGGQLRARLSPDGDVLEVMAE